MPSEFQFAPPNGELGAFQKLDVRVVFTPLACRRVRSVLQCDVLESQPRSEIFKYHCRNMISDCFEILTGVPGSRNVNQLISVSTGPG